MQQWTERYAPGSVKGAYVWQWAKDITLMKRLLKTLSVEEIERRMSNYLKSSEPFFVKNRHTFSLFVGSVNQFAEFSKELHEELPAPVGCKHLPLCRSDQEHTRRRAEDNGPGVGVLTERRNTDDPPPLLPHSIDVEKSTLGAAMLEERAGRLPGAPAAQGRLLPTSASATVRGDPKPAQREHRGRPAHHQLEARKERAGAGRRTRPTSRRCSTACRDRRTSSTTPTSCRT
jgi:hypothetical protein